MAGIDFTKLVSREKVRQKQAAKAKEASRDA